MADQRPVPTDKPTLRPILGIIALIAVAISSGWWGRDSTGLVAILSAIASLTIVAWRWGAKGVFIVLGLVVLTAGICTAVVLSTWEG